MKAYKKQKNYCVRLYKEERKKFFNKINPSFVKDNNLLWKTVKAIFSKKGNCGTIINLVKKDAAMQDYQYV